jgi:hypothetical protein
MFWEKNEKNKSRNRIHDARRLPCQPFVELGIKKVGLGEFFSLP